MYIALGGGEYTDDASLFEIVYADDTVMIAPVVSQGNRLAAYKIGSDEAPYEFLHSGRGPLEVASANFTSQNDTLYALSHDGNGLRNIIKIAVPDLWDMTKWESIDVSGKRGLFIGSNFDILSPAEYIIPGGKIGNEALLGVLSAYDGQFAPLAFWPDDGYAGAPIPKQGMYLRGNSSVLQWRQGLVCLWGRADIFLFWIYRRTQSKRHSYIRNILNTRFMPTG